MDKTVGPRFWIPSDNARKRERRDRVPYETWTRLGLIEMTPGNVIDYDHIRARINELGRHLRIREIAVDPWNATQLSIQLQGDGFEVVTFGQGFRDMSGPTKECLSRFRRGRQPQALQEEEHRTHRRHRRRRDGPGPGPRVGRTRHVVL